MAHKEYRGRIDFTIHPKLYPAATDISVEVESLN